MRSRKDGATPRIGRTVLASAWMAVVVAGFWAIEAYETTPGPNGRAPHGWPGDTSLRRIPGRPNLVMGVHPRCPCTRASLVALGEILRRTTGGATVWLLVFRPEGERPSWTGEAVAGMPGTIRVDDAGGKDAARFGLATSGAVAVFDAEGRRRFVGGITASRGRPDVSDGGGAVLAILGGAEADRDAADVYGCTLNQSTGSTTTGRRTP